MALTKLSKAIELSLLVNFLCAGRPSYGRRIQDGSSSDLGRNMGAIWGQYDSSSAKCKNDCIDKGLFYCGKDDYGTAGVCCDSKVDCPRQSGALCSFDAPTDSLGLQYWTCPRDPGVCGSREVIEVSGDTEKPNLLSLYSDWLIGASFANGTVCRFRLVFPYNAGPFDQITVTAQLIANVVAYVTETPKFSDQEPKQGRLVNNKDSFVATYPNEIFLTLVADDSGIGGEYELEFQFTDRNGDQLLALQERANVLAAEQARLEAEAKAAAALAAQQAKAEDESKEEDQDEPVTTEANQVVSEREVLETSEKTAVIDEVSMITMVTLVTIVIIAIVLSIVLMVYNRFKMLKKEAMMHDGGIRDRTLYEDTPEKKGKVAPLPLDTLAQPFSDAIVSPRREKEMFHVDEFGSVKVNPALMTADHSLKQSRKNMLDDQSDRFSVIMSMYNGKNRQARTLGDFMEEHTVDVPKNDQMQLQQQPLQQSDTIKEFGIDGIGSNQGDNFQLGSIHQSPRGSNQQQGSVLHSLPPVNSYKTSSQLVLPSIFPDQRKRSVGIHFTTAQSRPEILGSYPIEGSPVKSMSDQALDLQQRRLDSGTESESVGEAGETEIVSSGDRRPNLLIEDADEAKDDYCQRISLKRIVKKKKKKKGVKHMMNMTGDAPQLISSMQATQNMLSSSMIETGFGNVAASQGEYDSSVTYLSSAMSRRKKRRAFALGFSVQNQEEALRNSNLNICEGSVNDEIERMSRADDVSQKDKEGSQGKGSTGAAGARVVFATAETGIGGFNFQN